MKHYEVKLGRECGECTACCVHFAIAEVNKPMQEPCPKLKDDLNGTHGCHGKENCTIHDTRPERCKEYICAWLYGYGEEEDRPDKSGIMIDNIEWVPGSIIAKQMWRSARCTKEGKAALNNISEDMDKPVIVLHHKPVRGDEYVEVIGRGHRKA